MPSKQLTSGSARPLLSRQPFRFLFHTRLGKVFLVLVALRLLRLFGFLPSFVDGIVDLGLAIYLVGFLVRGLSILRSKLLWCIRRKLIISYLLIGMVPTVLILFFFLLSRLPRLRPGQLLHPYRLAPENGSGYRSRRRPRGDPFDQHETR